MLKQILIVNWCFIYAAMFIPAHSHGQDYIFKRFSVSEGLVNEVVLDIMEDSHGFLWLSTASGISRFDGKNFRNYGYTEGLEGLVVYKVYEDKKHRLWVGTSKGIAQLKGSRFKMYSDTGPGEVVVSNFGEFDGIGLVAFSEAGVYRFENDEWVLSTMFSGTNNVACREMVAADGGFYMHYDNEVIFRKQGMPDKTVLNDPDKRYHNYCNGIMKKFGKVYAGVSSQLYELSDGNAKLLIDSIPVNSFYNFTVDTGNTFWINSAGKGLFRYQLLPGKKKVSSYTYDSNTSGYPLLDAQGNLWITSYEGLVKAITKIFEDVTPPKILNPSKRLTIIPGVTNEVLFSDASGLHVIKDHKIQRIERPACYKDNDSYGQDVVEGFSKDNRGFTWFITRKRKMFCWTGSALIDYSSKLMAGTTDYIRNLAVNPVNNEVFMCDDTSLIHGNENGFAVYKDKKGQRFAKTTTVMFTRKGIGIVNVFSKGIYFITQQNEIIKAPPALDIIDNGSYTYFFEDRQGWIWISNAGKGLVRFRIDEADYSVHNMSVLTTEHGLPSNRIVSMAFDSEGNHWVSCANGIVILRKSDTHDTIWDTYRLGSDQGVNILPPAVVITDKSHNTLWLASINQLLKIDAGKVLLEKTTPAVVLEKVLLDMKDTDWKKFSDSVDEYFQLPVSPRLAHNQNALGIEFTGVSLSNNEYFEYSYKLEPLDTAWSTPSTNRYISLLKLVPANYAFSVKARGIGTDWSAVKTFDFTIRPPFWDTWWFRLLVAITAAAIIIAIYRNRIEKIQLQANMQNEILDLEMKALKAQMNPHFIYNALNSVQSLIASNKKLEAIDYIGKFSRLLRNILDYSDNNTITLDKELQALTLYIQLESLRLDMEPQYLVSFDEDIIPENEKLPPLILQPFVENALWHGLSSKEGSRRLTLSFTHELDHLVCVLEDNGIGRENAARLKSDLKTSKGIDITVKRLMDYNRSKVQPVEYTDLKNELGIAMGTRVVIRIKRHFV